jgi:hypothetical protein
MADARTHSRIGLILEKLIDVAVIKTAVIIAFLKKQRSRRKSTRSDALKKLLVTGAREVRLLN